MIGHSSRKITLDWLAGTFKRMSDNANAFMVRYASALPIVQSAAHNGYSTAVTDENGVVQSWNDDRPEMGVHVVFAGSAIRNICERLQVEQQAFLKDFINAGVSVSRLDIATDVIGTEINMSAIYQSLEAGGNVGNARTFAQIKSSGFGHTIYVGSRQSERFIRLYNKAAEQGLLDVIWFRFELETKGMVARALSSMLVENSDWHAVFVGVARRMVDLQERGLLDAFYKIGSVPIGIPKIERKSDTEKWILEQVIPAVSKWFVDHPDSNAVQRLMLMLEMLRDDLQG